MIKWYEESDSEVNRSIALLTGEDPDKWYPYGGIKGKDYCKNPSDAWPIIYANKIGLFYLKLMTIISGMPVLPILRGNGRLIAKARYARR